MHCAPEHCRSETSMTLFRTFVATSFALTTSNVEGRSGKCASWWSGPVARILCAQCCSHQRMQSTSPWFWTWSSSLPSSTATSNSSTKNSGAWSPDRAQRSMTRCLRIVSPARSLQFQVVSGCHDTPAHAAFSAPGSATSEPFLHRSCPSQIYRNDCPHPLAVHVQLICHHFNSQAAISMHLRADKHDVFLGPACDRPPAPAVILHILSSLLKPPVQLEGPSSRYCHLHTHPALIWMLLLEFFQAEQDISMWFVVRWSLCFSKNCRPKFFKTINARITTNKSLQKSAQLTQKGGTADVDAWEVDLHCNVQC